MGVVNISLPDDLLEKIDGYRKMRNENRSEFFKHAAGLYFDEIEKEIVFEKKKRALKRLMKIGEEIRKEGIFRGIDVVEEIRRLREERTDELLGKIK
ncbi:MAG: type II toxin-antitoxin system HicB family antitoxin [Actinobacteria bacterium]|nr:type II toxin-antitoxin system HicB family antitoxin [Actinomycetota bacterium]